MQNTLSVLLAYDSVHLVLPVIFKMTNANKNVLGPMAGTWNSFPGG